MGRGRVVAGTACAGVLAFGVSAAPAAAAQVVGSTLNGSPTNLLCGGCSASAVQTVKVTTSSFPVTPSADGVIVSLRLKHSDSGAGPDTFGFRLLAQALGTTFTARQPARLPDFLFPSSIPAGVRTFVPVDAFGRPQGAPVLAGELIGMVEINPQNAGAAILSAGTQATGGEIKFALGTHNSGTLDYSTNSPNSEILVQYTVEPDADGDGYGDETQDRCVGMPGPCIPPETVVQEVQTPVQQSLPTFGSATKVSLKLGSTRVGPGKTFSVTLRNANAFRVKGSLSIATKDRFKVTISTRQTVTLATKQLSLAGGGSQTFKVALPSELTNRLKKKGKLALSSTATVRDPAGLERTIKLKPTLRAKKRR
ncbi:MAG TPA: hypothetical protein VH279_07695 [Solirubrobacteraceae bacterium]|nr:hypothetical protein [Solirubrobacteraceae bacterium]